MKGIGDVENRWKRQCLFLPTDRFKVPYVERFWNKRPLTHFIAPHCLPLLNFTISNTYPALCLVKIRFLTLYLGLLYSLPLARKVSNSCIIKLRWTRSAFFSSNRLDANSKCVFPNLKLLPLGILSSTQWVLTDYKLNIAFNRINYLRYIFSPFRSCRKRILIKTCWKQFANSKIPN